MERRTEQWVDAHRYARSFLQRFNDACTREQRDDIAQEAVLMAWQWADCPRQGARLRASIRTIARRHRLRAIDKAERKGWLVYTEFGVDGVAEPAAEQPLESQLDIDGRRVPLAWARSHLRVALRCLSVLDQRLLLGFHEGFCCAELAQRFGRTRECVKSRIHRARGRLRREFEDLVRAADDFEGPDTKEREA